MVGKLEVGIFAGTDPGASTLAASENFRIEFSFRQGVGFLTAGLGLLRLEIYRFSEERLSFQCITQK